MFFAARGVQRESMLNNTCKLATTEFIPGWHPGWHVFTAKILLLVQAPLATNNKLVAEQARGQLDGSGQVASSVIKGSAAMSGRRIVEAAQTSLSATHSRLIIIINK